MIATASTVPAAAPSPAASVPTVVSFRSVLWDCPNCGYVGRPRTSTKCPVCTRHYVNAANKETAAKRKTERDARAAAERRAAAARGITAQDKAERIPAAVALGIRTEALDVVGAFHVVRLPAGLIARHSHFALHNGGVVPAGLGDELPDGAILLDTITRGVGPESGFWFAASAPTVRVARRQFRTAAVTIADGGVS